MRNRTITFAGKSLRIQESRIGELEEMVSRLFPKSEGKISDISIESIVNQIGFDLFYDMLPVIFSDITADDVRNAYPSEIEDLLEAFIDVNFTGVKRLIGPLLDIMQTGMMQPAGIPTDGSPPK